MFTYDDIVTIKHDAPGTDRIGQRAWVIGIFPPEGRVGGYMEQFSSGTVYSVEFEDGDAIEIHEMFLNRCDNRG